jgi:hypothetical protein
MFFSVLLTLLVMALQRDIKTFIAWPVMSTISPITNVNNDNFVIMVLLFIIMCKLCVCFFVPSLYTGRLTTQAVTSQLTKMIHSLLQNPSVVPTAWF